MKDWIYAITSQEMKKEGGPVKYIAKIRLHERQRTVRMVNRKWLCGVVPAAVALVPLATKGVYDLIQEHRQKKIVTDEEANQAEKDLIAYYEKPESEEPLC